MKNKDETRIKILEAAFNEIHENGYQAASISNILKNTGLTKGALYHYFDNKKKLGLAVVKEVVGGHLNRLWIKPIEDSSNSIKGLKSVLKYYVKNMDENDIRLGCPLNNLLQEMTPIDPDFRIELLSLSDLWIETIKNAFEEAKKNKLVSEDLDCEMTAHFFLSTFLGTITLGKTQHSEKKYRKSLKFLESYISSLAI